MIGSIAEAWSSGADVLLELANREVE